MMDQESLKEEFFRTATQYYIAGRFGALAWLFPVCGNLFHHAMEMYLKGALCEKLSKGQRRELGHDLIKLWQAFKVAVTDSSLNAFDQTIDSLNKFEDIRYPERIVEQGMLGGIGLKDGDVDFTSTTRSEPQYEITVSRIDSLIKIILDRSNINPRFIIGGFKKDAITYLKQYNDETIWAT